VKTTCPAPGRVITIGASFVTSSAGRPHIKKAFDITLLLFGDRLLTLPCPATYVVIKVRKSGMRSKTHIKGHH
jgi:hypothetical protein